MEGRHQFVEISAHTLTQHAHCPWVKSEQPQHESNMYNVEIPTKRRKPCIMEKIVLLPMIMWAEGFVLALHVHPPPPLQGTMTQKWMSLQLRIWSYQSYQGPLSSEPEASRPEYSLACLTCYQEPVFVIFCLQSSQFILLFFLNPQIFQ